MATAAAVTTDIEKILLQIMLFKINFWVGYDKVSIFK